jgi:hypothetical protein
MNILDIIRGAVQADGPKDWKGMTDFMRAGQHAGMGAFGQAAAANTDMGSSFGSGISGILGSAAANNAQATTNAMNQAAQEKFAQAQAAQKQQNFKAIFNAILGQPKPAGYTGPAHGAAADGINYGSGVSPLMQMIMKMGSGNQMPMVPVGNIGYPQAPMQPGQRIPQQQPYGAPNHFIPYAPQGYTS